MKTFGLTSLFVACAGLAHANDLGAAQDFNVVAFGNFTATSSTDSQGRVAVGGNYNSNSFTINGSNVGGGYGLITGGTTTSSSNTVNGGIFSNGNLSWSNPTINGNVTSNGSINYGTGGGSVNGVTTLLQGKTFTAPGYFAHPVYSATPIASPFNFASAQASLTAESGYLGTLGTKNGTVTDSYNNLSLTGSSSTYSVFDLTAAQLSSSTDLQLNMSGGGTAIVNVIGTGSTVLTIPSHGYSLSGTANDGNVLYNFVGISAVKLSGSQINGSMLLPTATLEDANGPSYGQIDGTVVCDNYNLGYQLNTHPFTGNLPTPEPCSMVALGLGGLGLVARRRKA